MGYCQVGGSTQACPPDDCKEIGGSHFEDSPGFCLLLSLLKDERSILMTSTLIYPTLIEFRKSVLQETPLGKEWSRYFDRFYEEAKDIARKDRKLVTNIVWLTTYVAPFLQAMLGQKPRNPFAARFGQGAYNSFITVMHGFRKRGSKEFVEALDIVEKQIAPFPGMTPREALRELRKPVAGGKTPRPKKKSANASPRKKR